MVSSSTNSGTPSVLSMIWVIISPGSFRPTVTCSTSARVSWRSSRSSRSRLTLARPTQGGSNSGRNVASASTGSRLIRSTARSNNSSVVASAQCMSSQTNSSGCCRARPSNWSRRAAKVCRRCCTGLRPSGGYRSPVGIESSAAMSGVVLATCCVPSASIASSLSSFCSGLSCSSMPAARSS